jgi:regulator of protease activity HflC (stomatin/prohibitin superfamily)
MILLIFGIILALVGIGLSRTNPKALQGGRMLALGGVVLAVFGFFTSMVKQIEPGQVGVKKLFGSVDTTDVLYNGLHVINPLTEVVTYDTKTIQYTMSATHSEGDQIGDDAIRVLTSDGLEVVIDLTVLFHIDPKRAPFVLTSLGSSTLEVVEKIVRPQAKTKIRDNAVYFDAVSLFSSKREAFHDKIYRDLNSAFSGRGLILEDILIRNVALPQSVKESIEAKINAEQDAQKMQFVLQKEKQEADRKRVEAQGIADYQRIITSTLTDRQLQYEQIKAQMELAKSPNSKIIVLGGGKNTPVLIQGN